MPRGDKSSYSGKQKRKAEHIERSYRKRGVSEKESERRAWATVNARDGGGKKTGSARKRTSRKRAGGRRSRRRSRSASQRKQSGRRS